MKELPEGEAKKNVRFEECDVGLTFLLDKLGGDSCIWAVGRYRLS